MEDYGKVVVGVDLGLTCTGVAWSTLNMEKPLVIQSWPGADQVVNKVRTAVTYRAGGLGVRSWGAKCPYPRVIPRGMDVKEYFKLFLDESVLKRAFENRPNESPTIEEVRLWFRDYLRKVYEYITGYFQREFRCTAEEWSSREVEYIFSVPTTWTEHSVVEDYREAARQAGFGTGENHHVEIGLTEPEASAIFTVKDQCYDFQIGDVLLVCDSGGGTTDTSVMKVVQMDGGSMRLEQISVVEGAAIGSVQIDDAFAAKVEHRLELVRDYFPKLPDYTAQDMVKGKFQDIKKAFGQHNTDLLESYTVEVPCLPPNYSNKDAGIDKEIEGLFDEQVEGIFRHIDPQLERLEQEGGYGEARESCLGSSAYLQKRFKARYEKDGKAEVLISKDPQLAVCKGLVIDRVQRIKHGISVLQTRRCRASYGILFNELYNKKHKGQTPHKGPLDGKDYAIDQIDWFIFRGEPISEDQPIIRRYSRIADANNPEKVWRDKIVICRQALGPENLPQHLTKGREAVRVVCEVKSDLQSHALNQGTDGVIVRSKHWWGFRRLGKKYLKIDHEVVIKVGPADLSFEIVFDGKAWNEDKVLPVEWMEQDYVAPEEAVEENGWQNGLVRIQICIQPTAEMYFVLPRRQLTKQHNWLKKCQASKRKEEQVPDFP